MAAHWVSNFILTLILVTVAILVHNFGHKLVAFFYGATTELRIWYIKEMPISLKPGAKTVKNIPLGAIIPLVVTLLTNGLLYFLTVIQIVIKSDPVKKLGRKWKRTSNFEEAKIMLAGPICSILLAYLIKATSTNQTFLLINTLLAVFTVIPIPKLDGAEAYINSRPLFGFGFFFIIASAILLNIATGTAITLILSIIIAILAGIICYYYTFK